MAYGTVRREVIYVHPAGTIFLLGLILRLLRFAGHRRVDAAGGRGVNNP